DPQLNVNGTRRAPRVLRQRPPATPPTARRRGHARRTSRPRTFPDRPHHPTGRGLGGRPHHRERKHGRARALHPRPHPCHPRPRTTVPSRHRAPARTAHRTAPFRTAFHARRRPGRGHRRTHRHRSNGRTPRV